jgi:small subunit ribosomal protein S1
VKVIEIRRDKIVVSHKIVERESDKINKQKELESIKVGDVLEGTIIKILDFGAFVKFAYAEGLIHISQISHHQVDKVSDVLKEGQKVKVKVIDADGDKRGLSLKALEATPWEAYAKTHKEGSKVTGKIIKKMQFGFLVEVAPDVVGMVNKFDYSWDPNYNLAGDVSEGDEIEVQILSLDAKKRRMQLSKKHMEYNPWDDVKVKIGEKVSGEVKVLQSGGALVEIQGVNAFLPIGEIKEERLERVADALKEGDVINAIVKKFDPRRWSLVISKIAYEDQAIREEYQQYMKTEEQDNTSQTLGELFAEKFASLKK